MLGGAAAGGEEAAFWRRAVRLLPPTLPPVPQSTQSYYACALRPTQSTHTAHAPFGCKLAEKSHASGAHTNLFSHAHPSSSPPAGRLRVGDARAGDGVEHVGLPVLGPVRLRLQRLNLVFAGDALGDRVQAAILGICEEGQLNKLLPRRQGMPVREVAALCAGAGLRRRVRLGALRRRPLHRRLFSQSRSVQHSVREPRQRDADADVRSEGGARLCEAAGLRRRCRGRATAAGGRASLHRQLRHPGPPRCPGRG